MISEIVLDELKRNALAGKSYKIPDDDILEMVAEIREAREEDKSLRAEIDELEDKVNSAQLDADYWEDEASRLQTELDNASD